VNGIGVGCGIILFNVPVGGGAVATTPGTLMRGSETTSEPAREPS